MSGPGVAAAVEERAAPGMDARPDTRNGVRPAGGRRRTWSRYRFWETATPYLFVAPVLVIVGVFVYWPLLYSTYLAFFDWNFVAPTKDYVGIVFFVRLVFVLCFHRALWGTLIYIVALVLAQVFLPRGLAVLLWPIRRSRAQAVYRATLFSPTVISFSVAA